MATTKTADYATLTLLNDDAFVAAGGTFTFTVAPTLKAGRALYQPVTTYKLFVRLPKGLRAQSVIYASGTAQVVEAEKGWTGASGEYSAVQDAWEKGSGQQEEAYNLRLLATWTSSVFTDTTNTHPLGWDIKVTVDTNHDSTPAAIQATLMVMQDNHLKPALSAEPLTITITSAGPEFSSVTLPGADAQSGKFIMPAETHQPFKISAILAKPSTAEKMLVRWQVKGAGDSWSLAEPNGLDVIGGTGGTQLKEFTIQNNFKSAVTLLFSCAVPVPAGDQPNWGLPFSVDVDFEAGLLSVEDPVVRVSGTKIILTCDLLEPTTHVKFDRLEISYDRGGSWQAISGGITGTVTPYHVNYEITMRDFSQGVQLRVWDKLGRPVRQSARFDMATFLTVTWGGKTTTGDDINLGEAVSYSILLECALHTVLPSSTIDLQLPGTAVDVDPTGTSGYSGEDTDDPHGGFLFFFPATGWSGTGAAVKFYQGLLRSGEILAECLVRENTALLNQTLPAAQLIFRGEDFLTQPLEFTEIPKAKVFRPAPSFQFIQHLPEQTNRYALNFKGSFMPQLELNPDLVFTIAVDSGAAKTLPPASITTVTKEYFEFSLDHNDFKVFDTDGDHQVKLTLHRRTDTRPPQRSSHSEILPLKINNGEASFEDTTVEVESGFLRLDGTVVSPSEDNPVKEVLLAWDGSGHGTAQKPVRLNKSDELHFTFEDSLELTKFKGTLHTTLRAFTASKAETPLNVFFSTARYLLDIKLQINSTSVSDEGTQPVPQGTATFRVDVTSLVGLPQKLNMFMSLGKSFSAGKITTTLSPAANQGKLNATSPANSWNGSSSAQLLQSEGLVQGATFAVTGSFVLKKVEGAPSEAETIDISFTETDSYTKQTFNAIDKDDGVIFSVRLIPQ